jgi:hypothetical protein
MIGFLARDNASARYNKRNLWDQFGDDNFAKEEQHMQTLTSSPEKFKGMSHWDFEMLVNITQDDDLWHRLQESMRNGEFGVGNTEMSVRASLRELLKHHFLLAAKEGKSLSHLAEKTKSNAMEGPEDCDTASTESLSSEWDDAPAAETNAGEKDESAECS